MNLDKIFELQILVESYMISFTMRNALISDVRNKNNSLAKSLKAPVKSLGTTLKQTKLT